MNKLVSLRILHKITTLVTKELSPEKLLPLISMELEKIVIFDRISIAIYNKDKALFELRAIVTKDPKKAVFRGTFPARGSRTNLCMTKQETVYFPDLMKRKDYFETNYLIDEGYLSGICIPLIMGKKCFGTVNFNSRRKNPFTPEQISFLESVAESVAIAMRNALAFEELNEVKDRLSKQNKYLVEESKGGLMPPKFVGVSKVFRQFLEQIEVVACSNATVVLYGETGTGKEIAADLIHDKSPRLNGPLVKVNCAALPAELLESELFGYERGAFTGAVKDKIGRFELADEGTLFLDEISELSLGLQSKLLRVLQDGKITKVGSTHSKHVDFRVIAATNRNLLEEVKKGNFRKDLFFRLNVFPIELPPLRKRMGDLTELIDYFIKRFSITLGKSFRGLSTKSIDLMSHYSWPGNIRELANVLERACILTPNEEMINISTNMLAFQDEQIHEEFKSLEQVEREYLIKVLNSTRGKIEGKDGAAAILEIHPNTLRSRLKKFEITIDKLAG